MTSSQVPTQPQRTNDTPTVRVQPVAATREPAWPTTEPMTATNLTPVAAATTKFEPVRGPANGLLDGHPNGRLGEALTGRLNGTADGAPAPLTPAPPATARPAAARPTDAPPAFTPQPAFAPAAPATPTAEAAATPAPPVAEPTAAPAAKPTPPATPRSRLRRIARRIVGPTLLTKKN